MARILIVDDQPINRQFLAKLLGYSGHQVFEAGDGLEALELLRAERPDLTICDLLMPRMDGYEFVRRVRRSEEIASSNIIFYTATYHRTEAKKLADASGIQHIITKPAEPEEILRVVALALSSGPPVSESVSESEFRTDHLRLLTDSLVTKSNELETANARLAALIDLGIDLGAERDIDQLLSAFAETIREIIPARWSAVAILHHGEDRIAWFHAGGAMNKTALAPVMQARSGILGMMVTKGKPSRVAGLEGDPAVLGFPKEHPPLDSFLGVPLVRGPERIGWFYLADRLEREGFTDEDEKIGMTLAAMLVVTYTNLRMAADVRTHAVQLEGEIAERRRAEMEVRRLALHNALLLDSAGEGIYGIDPKGITTFVNPAAARMLGYAPGEILGQRQHDLIHHTHADGTPYPREECRIYRALADGQTHRVDDEVFWRRDGTSFPVEYNSVPLRGDDGAIVGAVVTFNDITARRRAEEELRASEQKLRLLVEGVRDYALVMLDTGGQIASWSAAAERITGLPEEEVLGTPVEACLRRAGGREHLVPVEEARNAGSFEFEGWCARADGSRFWVAMSISPLTDAGGSMTGFAMLLRDRTEQKRREEELEQERRLSGLGHVAATVGHEFNNVLMGISPFVELLRKKASDPEAVLRAAETIGKSIRRGKNLTADILRYTRPAEPVLKPVAVAPWLAEMRAELQNLVGPNIEVKVDGDFGDAWVAADANQLAQVITNLAANARDAMDGRGVLEISGALENGNVVIQIRDSGTGMPQETVSRIFEPLFTTKRTGTGLGLAVAYTVIRKHSGSITVDSVVGIRYDFHNRAAA